MKKLYFKVLLLGISVLVGASSWAQTTITTATFTGSSIESDINFNSLPGNSTCFGTLSLNIPAGETIYDVDVTYDYIAGNGAWLSEQRSWLYCVTNATGETNLATGPAVNSAGTENYSRSTNIANGIVGGTVDFELHLGRTWGGTACDPGYNYVPDGTWTVTVYSATCVPPSGVTLGPIDNDSITLSWTAGGSETMWNVEIGNAGFTPGTGAGTISAVTSTNDTIDGLTAITDYDVYVQANCGADSSSWVGPVSFTTAANCPDVSGVVVDNVTSDSIMISWVSNGSETMWDVSWGTPGYTPSGAMSSVMSTADTITGLTPEESYDIYVRSNCGGTDSGAWIGPLVVQTTCAPITSFPYMNGFEGNTDGWLIVDIGNSGLTPSWEIGVPSATIISSAANGSNAAVTNLAGNYQNDELSALYTPCFDFSNLVNPVVTFNLNINTEAGFDGGYVEYSTDLGNSWNRLGSDGSGYCNWYNSSGDDWWEGTDISGWNESAHSLDFLAGESEVRLRFVMSADNIVNGFEGIGVDDFMIEDEPCARPTLANIDYLVSDTLVFSWTENGGATSWNIEYGPIGFTPGTGTSYTTTNNPDTLTGLVDGQIYDFYIVSDCGGGSVSKPIKPLVVAAPVVNDNACDALLVPVDGLLYNYHNINATSEPSEPFSGNGNTVWFKAVVPASGHFAIFTCDSDVEVELNVYDAVPTCGDLSTASVSLSTTTNPFGCGFGYGGAELCGLTPNDTVYFTIESYNFGNGEGVFNLALFDLEFEAGVGSTVDACAGDTVNLAPAVSGTNSLYAGVYDYPFNPNAIVNDSLMNSGFATVGGMEAYFIVGNSCMSDTAVIDLNISTQSNSGVAIDPFNGCNTGDIFLMNGLTGTIDAGGTWDDDLNTGLLNGNVFQANGIPPGQYQFTYNADAGACPSSSTQITVTVQNCVSVEENAFDFGMYPNPTNGLFTIQSDLNGQLEVVVTDAQGRLIQSNTFNQESMIDIDLGSVESGVYFVKVISNGNSVTKSIVIK